MRRLALLLILLATFLGVDSVALAQPGGTLPRQIRALVGNGGRSLGTAIRSNGSLVAALRSGDLTGNPDVAAFIRAAQARQVPDEVVAEFPELHAAMRDLRSPSQDLRAAMGAFMAVEQPPTGAYSRLTAKCNIAASPSLQSLADAVFKVAGRAPPLNYTAVPKPPPNTAVIVNLNVENLFAFRARAFARGADRPHYLPRSEAEYRNKLHKVALGIVNELHGPDVIGLEEISDVDTNAGGVLYGQRVAGGDGLPDVLADLIEEIRIVSNGEIVYTAHADVAGADHRGILQGLLLREGRAQLVTPAADHPIFGTRPHDEMTGMFPRNAEVANPKAINTRAPEGALNDGRGEALYGRPPLVAQVQLTIDGSVQKAYIIVDHYKSRADEFIPRREAQADFSGQLADEILAVEPDALVIDMGDKNTPHLDQLRGLSERLHLANSRLPEGEQYSFNFRGNMSELDYAFLSAAADERLIYVQSVHLNSQSGNHHKQSASSPFGAGDHDPLMLWLYVGDGQIPPFRQFVANTPE